MKEKITFNDLILFAFNETELAKTVSVAEVLETDHRAQGCYNDIQDTLSGIRIAGVVPSEKTDLKILELSGS